VRLEDPPGLSPITTVGRLPRFEEEAPGVVLLRNCMGLAETRSTIADEVAHLAGASEREAAATRPSGVGAWWATPREPAEPTAGDCAIHAAEQRVRRERMTSAGGDLSVSCSPRPRAPCTRLRLRLVLRQERGTTAPAAGGALEGRRPRPRDIRPWSVAPPRKRELPPSGPEPSSVVAHPSRLYESGGFRMSQSHRGRVALCRSG
jgi:hypothetical protein